ncbi:MAG: murein L,D-transpeptidase family protein [Candidatus Methylacidiphilales bacterium]
MKSIILFCLFLFGNVLMAQVPTSKRSVAAYAQNQVLLKKQFADKKLAWGSAVFIRIYKQSNELQIWVKQNNQFVLFKIYNICYYSGTLGTKTKTGDGQAPEGIYKVFPHQMNPNSSYHLSFNIGYPKAFDKANGYTGSHIMVHGSCVSIGCFAMTNPIIEEIWTLMEAAFTQKQSFVNVFIFPFKLTQVAIESNSKNASVGLWKQLWPIDSLFDQTHKIPNVTVIGKKYVLVK